MGYKFAGCVFWVLLVLITVVVMSVIFAFPTMWLWNWLMPHLFSLPRIDILEALGINLLAGLLFKSSLSSSSSKD